MSIINDQLDFSTVADVFLAHGSLQSPAFLDGRLSAELALHDLPAQQWLEEVSAALGVEQPRDREDAEVLLGWRRQTLDALSAPELNYEPLLPDDLFSLAERARGLKEWTLGFLEVVSEVGAPTRDAWSANLREALEDLEALASIDELALEDSADNENDLFALAEHARMAAMLLYTEQHPGSPQVEQADDDAVQ
ncbi:hypothetical protein SAMN02745148_00932 [Modicisalibacter ilicicola DSM 19980]|uniref:YecA family protein n=1 Tax=Modicisalibacter ilicicola DSM 19980 TaxID=1121942 RepID=A0A1M4VQH6_9GAMM|nr:UPF0149 family protein [Halomonas ilicicola]SHE71314.1 hypothetical protein SAMN02745148_00932 [Halomonas ilicicola DSM 19980]